MNAHFSVMITHVVVCLCSRLEVPEEGVYPKRVVKQFALIALCSCLYIAWTRFQIHSRSSLTVVLVNTIVQSTRPSRALFPLVDEGGPCGPKQSGRSSGPCRESSWTRMGQSSSYPEHSFVDGDLHQQMNVLVYSHRIRDLLDILFSQMQHSN